MAEIGPKPQDKPTTIGKPETQNPVGSPKSPDLERLARETFTRINEEEIDKMLHEINNPDPEREAQYKKIADKFFEDRAENPPPGNEASNPIQYDGSNWRLEGQGQAANIDTTGSKWREETKMNFSDGTEGRFIARFQMGGPMRERLRELATQKTWTNVLTDLNPEQTIGLLDKIRQAVDTAGVSPQKSDALMKSLIDQAIGVHTPIQENPIVPSTPSQEKPPFDTSKWRMQAWTEDQRADILKQMKEGGLFGKEPPTTPLPPIAPAPPGK